MDSHSSGFEEGQDPVPRLIDGAHRTESRNPYFLKKFSLFKTRSNFYLVGRDRSKKIWRVLKIDRLAPSELVLYEDPTEYALDECCILLQRIQDGNIHVGGRKFVSTCYGIVGFIQFLGPYYMLLITKRRKLGEVCGHPIYGISSYRLIKIPHKSVLLKPKTHADDDKYKKLLRTLNLTTEFYFSYTYPLMHSLQRNLSGNETVAMSYTSPFVWNEYLTQEIRKHLRNCLWTVALVHGFFKQVKLSKSGYNFSVTLVARRSRLNAGTRYLKRGVNEKGEAANDVEIEQIVCQEIREGLPYKITSLVQDRGSIPLFWFQLNSWKNLKPEILLLNVDDDYEATRLHFEELRNRYGDPIVILNLVKACEKKPRESVLSEEFHKAIAIINMTRETLLQFECLDLGALFKSEGTTVLTRLNEVASQALDQIGFLSFEVVPPMISPRALNMELNNDESNLGKSICHVKDMNKSETGCKQKNNLCTHHCYSPQMIQDGVVRTNCIDCIDRTNVAQFMQGYVALLRQMNELGIPEPLEIDSGNECLMFKIMDLYKEMGDFLSWQYGGSAARSKIFAVKRGEWKPATGLKEMLDSLQRYYSNVVKDNKKQKSINLFLGHLRPGVEPQELLVITSGHSSDIEEPVSTHQNLISSSSPRPLDGQSGCFLCEGLSLKNPEKTTHGHGRHYSSQPALIGNRETSWEPFASETESMGATMSAVTSESDVFALGHRCASAPLESQIQAFTDAEERFWFGSPRSLLSDTPDLDSTSSSAYFED